jgi:linoleoyl-CoA desaturase
MKISEIKFEKSNQVEFVKELRRRVNDYFSQTGKSRFGDYRMVIKTVFMVALFYVPYTLMIGGVASTTLQIFICWILMAGGMSGIGLSVMHDANHGAYSKYKWVNTVLGYLLNFMGGSSLNWRIQHNVLHHSFTNVHGMDEDIDAGKILRFSPQQEWYWFHRFQHIYAWFLYGLMTHMWVTTKDIKGLIKYYKADLLQTQGVSLKAAVWDLVISKVVYFGYMIVVPIIVLPIPWYLTLVFFFIMHFLVGLLLASIFQTAHVMETSEYPEPDAEGRMENSWAIHQLLTTANYAPKSKLFSWFVGGLNFQIEHHLFPNICHVHYKNISEIVKKTAQDFNLPYNVEPTFYAALKNHWRMLKGLGSSPVMA